MNKRENRQKLNEKHTTVITLQEKAKQKQMIESKIMAQQNQEDKDDRLRWITAPMPQLMVRLSNETDWN